MTVVAVVAVVAGAVALRGGDHSDEVSTDRGAPTSTTSTTSTTTTAALDAASTGFGPGAGSGSARAPGAVKAAPAPAPGPAPTPATAPPAPVTTTTQPVGGPTAPLTGLRIEDPALVARPALAVKIDNFDAPRETAVPQSGLPGADIVFEELVEGNITRLVAIFHSRQPGRVGPVRSARTTDLAILPQFGRALLAWSGGNKGVTAAVRANPSIIDVGVGVAPGAYARDRGRRAPHNLYVSADGLFGRAPAGTAGPGPLFQYRTPGQPNPPGAVGSAGVDLAWGPFSVAPVSWRWDSGTQLYVRSQAGRAHSDASGKRITAANVVVLVTPYGQSPADTRSPEAHTVGSGEALVYTNGGVIRGRWDRPDVRRPAAISANGAPILLTPGNTWIELPRGGGATTVS